MRNSLIVSLIFAMALGSMPTLVFAQETEAPKFSDLSDTQKRDIAALMKEAKAAYDRGKFESSLETFQKAYDIFPHPDIFYRMALCYQGLGEDSEAIRYFRLFLSAVPDAPERPRIEKIIETMESRVSSTTIFVESDPKGALIYIDDVANGVVGETPANIQIRPGNYRLIVEMANHERVEELVTVKAGETIRLRYQLKLLSDLGPAPEPPDSGSQNTAGIVTLVAVGVSSTIASLVFFSLYGDAKEDLDSLEAQPPQNVSRDRIDDTRTKMYTFLGLSVGTAAVATGTLIWAYFLWSDSSSSNGSSSMPTNSPAVWWNDGPGAGWSWSW